MREGLFVSKLRGLLGGTRRGPRTHRATDPPRPVSPFTFETLESRILLTADLTGLVTAHTLADPSVPTNVETATVQVKDQGTTAATVSTQVRVYASTDSTFSTSDVLLGTTTTAALSAGQSRNVLVNLTMPNTLAAGSYKLLSRVDATSVVAEGTVGEANNTGVGPSFTVAWQFGAVPGRTGNTVLTLRDADGTAVTFRLTGPGVGTVVKDGTSWDLKLTGTNTTSAVTITTSGGNGRVTLNDIQTAGPLASFTAATMDVNGTVAINGTITTLTLGDELGGTVAAKSITARNLSNAKLYIGTTLGQDGKLGGMSTNVDAYGLGRLQTFVLTGSMTGSTVRVSVNPVDGIFGNGNDQFVPGTPTGIGSIKIQGTLSADSCFIAPTIPTTYVLVGQTRTITGDVHFLTNLTNQPPVAGNDAFTVKNGSVLSEITSVVLSRDRNFSFPSNFVNVNGTLYFTAGTAATGRELWKSNGTPRGTVLVKDIVLGTGSSNPEQLINVNGTLFFTAETANEGRELWKSNAAGTFRVTDINPGSGDGFSFLRHDLFINVNGKLFFTANDGATGVELWTSDGTTTRRVKDIVSGPSTSNPSLFTVFKNALYFTAWNTGTNNYDFWRSDGTGPGTQVFRHFNGSGTTTITDLEVVGNTLFFTADDGVHGFELWKTDGTTEPGGTVLVKDINSFTGVGITSSNPANLTNVNGVLFFTANDSVNGHGLWRSNGMEDGTVLVRNITPDSGSSFRTDLTSVGGKLFFRKIGSNSELWVSNGTATGTVPLTPNGLQLPGNANGSPLITDVGGVAYFRAGGTGGDLGRSDGTVAGTTLVRSGVFPKELTNVNGTLFFRSGANSNFEILKLTKVNVLTNDRDPEGKPLTAALVTGLTKGTLTLNANETFTYRPNVGFIGTDSFTYRASDGLLQSNLAMVTIAVTA